MKLFCSSSSMMALLYITCVFLLFVSCEGKVQLPQNVTIKAVFAFGDSIVDQGNNNYITTLVKCNFQPYGIDFMGGKPTGRFTNGKTPSDLIVEELGIKEIMPAYLDPDLQPEDLKTGVSFASGASGYDPQTSAITLVISLSAQLDLFKQYIWKLKGLVGEDEANDILGNALYLVVAGSDDLANTYFTVGIRRVQYDVNSYTDLMTTGASNFVQELYKLGARRIGVFGTPPIGCLPSMRTLSRSLSRDCSEEYNEAAKLANIKLSAALSSLSQNLPQSKLVYIDIYKPLLDLIVNPKKYGLEVVDKGCCGTGHIEVSILCNIYSGICEDDTKYLFWDSYHPTEKGYRLLVDEILLKYVNRLI